ncbi:hypothetical protein BDZ45DRAFT_786549 [Acephala macrosclerotiorum]|nr:hypothetical protein BDZ45DRAFT_786549 [Acephala macrosclerotiorum]
MLYFIANPTTVNKIRLDAGIKGDLESKEFVFVRVRRSNRIKCSAQKRKFNTLQGLASPCKRKRKTSKKPLPTSANENPTVNDKSSANVDTEVSTSSAVDEPGDEVTVGGAAVGTPAAVDEPDTEAATEDTAVGTLLGHIESVSSEVMTDALQSSSQSTSLRPWTLGSITDNSSPEPSFTTVQPEPLLSCPLPTMADLLNPEHASRVVTSVLLELVNQHDKIGQFSGRTDTVTSTTNTAKIRAFTKELARLEYEAAVYSIKKRNAMHASNGIQIGSDENAYWEIILKGVQVLDFATLPKGSPKGPLDGFSAAEKIATYNFMKHAGFGISPENQR